MDRPDVTFGRFRFHWGSNTLFADGVSVGLGRRAANLLATLLARRGEVVSKDELISAGWPDATVEESNLTVQMASLRSILRASTDDPEWINTVPRVGYRFIDSAAEPATPTRATDGGETHAAIAVLPFVNMSSDPEQAYFADGIAEDLITDLSKVAGLVVIARNSSFAYRDRPIDFRQLVRDLRVRYVVEGSVRRAGDRVRIAAQLIDAETTRHLWADRFDGELIDVFSLQDKVVGRIVSALADVLPLASSALPLRRSANVEAYKLFLRARPLVTRSPEGNRIAQPLLIHATEIDPTFAEAHAWLAISRQFGRLYWGQEASGADALALAERAVELDPGNPDAHMALGYLRAYAFELDAGIVAFERTLELNPNHADAWCLFADLKVFDGKPLEGIECARRAFRLNPRPPSQYYWLLGWSQYAAGQYEDAVVTLANTSARDTGCQRIRAAALAQLGRTEDARLAVREFLSIIPHFSTAEWAEGQPFRHAADLQHFVDGYILAGLPA